MKKISTNTMKECRALTHLKKGYLFLIILRTFAAPNRENFTQTHELRRTTPKVYGS